MGPLGTLGDALGKFWESYVSTTPQKLKIIDSFLIFQFLTGVFQFVYAVLVGSFPFNAFLAGFICCVGCFVLTVGLRIQVNPKNNFELSTQRAYADYALCNILLFFVCLNFLG